MLSMLLIPVLQATNLPEVYDMVIIPPLLSRRTTPSPSLLSTGRERGLPLERLRQKMFSASSSSARNREGDGCWGGEKTTRVRRGQE